jgi:hypothetical protein
MAGNKATLTDILGSFDVFHKTERNYGEVTVAQELDGLTPPTVVISLFYCTILFEIYIYIY